MTRDALLALGLLLSTASQLRLPGVPLGPGELLLAIWILLATVDATIRRAPPLTRAISRLLIFWAVFAFAQSVGQLFGLVIEEFRDTTAAIHTAQAYVLGALLSCLAVVQPEAGWRLRRVAWMIVGGGAVSLAVLVAGGHGILRVPGMEFWVYNRFIGWSKNPNQLALLCTVLVPLSLYLAETAAQPKAKIYALLCAVPVFAAGILTRSDSFILAMLFVGPMFVGLKLLTWVFAAERQPSLYSTFACLIFLSIPIALVSTAPFAPKIIEKAHEVATETMEENDQAEGRFRIWRDAMEIGFDAGMMGLGPGPHLVTKQLEHPPPNKTEAHNTTLDLFTQGGLLATLSFFWVTATAFLVTQRAKLVGLSTLLLALFVFSNFHLIVRHPIFWFSIALCLTAAEVVHGANTGRDGAPLRGSGHRPDPPRLA